MDPVDNPYTPNAGAVPPVLVGRDDQIKRFDLLLARLERGHTEQSMIISGLRGVGKTALLGTFRAKAESKGWAVIEIEARKGDDKGFRTQLSYGFRTALLTISPRNKWHDRAKAAASILRSFTLSIDGDGRFTAGFDVEPFEGKGDSGLLELDLEDVLLALGAAAREHGTGVLLLFDEIQDLPKSQLEGLIMALHKTVQRSLPITMIGAGLPQSGRLAVEAKSYSERLFVFPQLGQLSFDDACAALERPALPYGVTYAPKALTLAYEMTSGYPYFIQELGYAAWPIAVDNVVTRDDIANVLGVFEAKLDSSFFRMRLDRAAELERAYLRAMAELGDEPHHASDVAALLGRTSAQCGPTRSALVEKGLLYTPQHGYASFTVPHFDRFMKRAMPELTAPPIQSRKRNDYGSTATHRDETSSDFSPTTAAG